MKDVVIDFETLSTKPNAVIPSVGVRVFDPMTGRLGQTLHIRMDVQEQIDAGYAVDAGTLAFWMKQEQEGRSYMIKILEDKKERTVSRAEGFRVLHTFLSCIQGVRPWGNGISFDLGICYAEWGNDGLPWEFWNERDVRTLVATARLLDLEDYKSTTPFEGVPHNPVSDATHCAKYISAYMKDLKVAVDIAIPSEPEPPKEIKPVVDIKLEGMIVDPAEVTKNITETLTATMNEAPENESPTPFDWSHRHVYLSKTLDDDVKERLKFKLRELDSLTYTNSCNQGVAIISETDKLLDFDHHALVFSVGSPVVQEMLNRPNPTAEALELEAPTPFNWKGRTAFLYGIPDSTVQRTIENALSFVNAKVSGVLSECDVAIYGEASVRKDQAVLNAFHYESGAVKSLIDCYRAVSGGDAK